MLDRQPQCAASLRRIKPRANVSNISSRTSTAFNGFLWKRQEFLSVFYSFIDRLTRFLHDEINALENPTNHLYGL